MKNVHILIPDTKDSDRFPGKNDLLEKYTFDWLAEELEDGVHVWYLLCEDDKWTGSLDSENLHVLFVPFEIHDNHKQMLSWVTRHICEEYGNDSRFVQLQLTQPVKRSGMLKEIVDGIDENNVVLTYTLWGNYGWRLVDNGTLEYESERDNSIHRFYDGTVVAWKGLNSDRIFDLRHQKKHWVKNYTGPVCDVDYAWEYNENYVKGLQELCNQNENYENIY